MAAELILEIGTEEIPSGYLVKGLEDFKRLATSYFKENRITIGRPFDTYGTPRRLVLIGNEIAERQGDLVQEITGPPINAAYDKDGRPTKAASGFAQKQGVKIEELESVKTPKGEYLYVTRLIPGRQTSEILVEILPRLIKDIPWPKSMRWGDLRFPFVRPIHWLLALLNGKVVPFEAAGIRSGNKTLGHRFMAPDSFEVSDVQDYFGKIREKFVLVDPQEREKIVLKVATNAAEKVGGVPAQDGDLLTTVANLAEFPSAVCGCFDDDFLNLPDPVLITAMKEHQKYFAVYDGEGRLMSNFVAVNNTVARDESVVRKGHERVLRARLSDAEFFFKEDRKRPLSERIGDLKEVIYQAKLGTSYAKVKRFSRLAEYLGKQVLQDKLDAIQVVADLCKCDLVTQLVTEFPTLQGVMGMEYARMEGYPEAICQGIFEHYLPTGADSRLPTSKLGAVVGIADRMDTIAGCFAAGLEPSGSKDPFALRRHALAIIRIAEDMKWDFSLNGFVEEAISILREQVEVNVPQVFAGVIEFFRERYKQMMLRSGYESDLIEAVISAEFDRINQLRSRIDQVKMFVSESNEFNELALAFKRVLNILKKQNKSCGVNPDLFKESCESALWDSYEALKGDVDPCLENGDYYKALKLMAELRKPVDGFFDGVEILTKEDQALRENRVGVLQHLARLFLRVADLSKFSI